MGVLRRFEKRLERAFESPFTRAFRGGVHPLEVARRLAREVDDGKVLGLGETLAPNRFLVRLSPPDHERLSGILEGLGAEMESLVISYANERGYHLATRPEVVFEEDVTLREGEYAVSSWLEEATKGPPATERVEIRTRDAGEERLGVLAVLNGEKAGLSFYLEGTKTSIGRAEDNDLVLPDPR